MRSAGTPASLQDLRCHDHACWAFDDPAEWQARAVEFLGDGLAQGQQVRYIGVGDPAELADQLSPLGDVASLLATGRLLLAGVDAAYAAGAFDPAGQVAVFAGVAREGVQAGFTGVRVAADVTPLAGDSTQFEAYARYEHLVDRLIATTPLTGLCGLDRRTLDADVVDKLACLHPVGPGTPFRLYSDGTSLVLEGEVETLVAERFEWALAHLPTTPAAVMVDARGATFLDHRALLALEAVAARHDRTVVLRTVLSTAPLIVEVLGLRRVLVERVEPAAARPTAAFST